MLINIRYKVNLEWILGSNLNQAQLLFFKFLNFFSLIKSLRNNNKMN